MPEHHLVKLLRLNKRESSLMRWYLVLERVDRKLQSPEYSTRITKR